MDNKFFDGDLDVLKWLGEKQSVAEITHISGNLHVCGTGSQNMDSLKYVGGGVKIRSNQKLNSLVFIGSWLDICRNSTLEAKKLKYAGSVVSVEPNAKLIANSMVAVGCLHIGGIAMLDSLRLINGEPPLESELRRIKAHV